MKNPGTINHATDALLRPSSELKRGEMLKILSQRYHYGENTLRMYIYKGEVFSSTDLKTVYENIEQSDAEYLSYVNRVKETQKQVGHQLQDYGKTHKVNVGRKRKTPSVQIEGASGNITIEGGTASSWSSDAVSVFVELKQDIDNQIKTLEQKKESIEEFEQMYARLQSKQ